MYFVEATTTELSAINKLVEMSHCIDGSGYIHTEADWDFVKALWKFWKVAKPEHYAAFMREMKGYTEGYKDNKFGVAEDKGGGFLQHLGNMPDSFMWLLEQYFPNQKYNKQFYSRLRNEISDFNLTNKL